MSAVIILKHPLWSQVNVKKKKTLPLIQWSFNMQCSLIHIRKHLLNSELLKNLEPLPSPSPHKWDKIKIKDLICTETEWCLLAKDPRANHSPEGLKWGKKNCDSNSRGDSGDETTVNLSLIEWKRSDPWQRDMLTPTWNWMYLFDISELNASAGTQLLKL